MSAVSSRSGASPEVRALLLLLLVATTLARLALAGLLDLGQDEAYALAVSRSFQWSFFDHPPLAFWFAGLMQAVGGRELPPILLRLPFVLMFTGSTAAMFALTRRFYGERAGLWAAGLLNTAPFFFASAGSWVVPDGPLTLFLLLAAIFLARALAEPPAMDGRWRDWLLAGLFLGLALLSKYQAGLTLAGAFLLLLSRPHRSWLVRPHPYAAAGLALLLFVPVIWWNADHNWVSFRFQLGRDASGSPGFGFGRLPILLLGEAIYLLPWTLLGLLAAICVRRAPADRFFLALALPAILLFNLLPLIGPAGLPHWSMAGWLFLFPLLGRWLAAARAAGRRGPAIFGWLSGLGMVAVAIAGVGLLSDHRFYAGNPEIDHALVEATDWSGVRAGLESRGLLDRPNTFYAALSWLDGAHIAEAVRPAVPPVVFGGDPRGFAFVGNANSHLGEDAIFVCGPEAVADIEAFAARHFDSIEVIGNFETAKGGQPAYSQTVLLAHHFATPVTVPYGNGT